MSTTTVYSNDGHNQILLLFPRFPCPANPFLTRLGLDLMSNTALVNTIRFQVELMKWISWIPKKINVLYFNHLGAGGAGAAHLPCQYYVHASTLASQLLLLILRA